MKKKILYINSVDIGASTGYLTNCLMENTYFDSYLCYGRKKSNNQTNKYKITSNLDVFIAMIKTIFLNNNLYLCKGPTKKLINKIIEYNPDIIHIHVVHGYYLNINLFFSFLKKYNKPIVWTFHDCWPITGYCPCFDIVHCNKYIKECNKCEYRFSYPFSIFKQNVKKDYYKKKMLFNELNNLTIVTPSKWLENIVKNSFLKSKNIMTIYNGVNISEIKYKKNGRFTVLAVSSFWTKEKGVEDLIKIIDLLKNYEDVDFIVIGRRFKYYGPNKNVTYIKYIDDINELYKKYGEAHIFINPTKQDSFGMVNVEALSNGTPVIVYNSGGCPEIINEKVGFVIENGNYNEMANKIIEIKSNYYFDYNDLINRAKEFSIKKMCKQYDELYSSL